MTQYKRLQDILKYLEINGQLSVETAVAEFRASPATVRRDFLHLEAEGLAEKVRGGVRRRAADRGKMTPFWLREEHYFAEKEAIARAAAGLLSDGDSVMIDGGTSTFHLAHFLGRHAIRVITNSLRIAAFLADQPYGSSRINEVIVSGGTLYPSSFLLTGRQTRDGLRQYYANIGFLSVGGIAADGITNTNESVIESEQIIIANSSKVVVLADHSKLGRHAMCQVATLDKINLLITDEHPESAETVAALRQSGLEVMFAPVRRNDGEAR